MPQGRLLPTCSTISIPRFSSFSRIRAQFHSPRGLSQSKIFSGFTHIQHWIVEFVGRALHLVKHNFLDNCPRTRGKPWFWSHLSPFDASSADRLHSSLLPTHDVIFCHAF